MVRALAMVSGGLDSILAAKLIKDQGIEVIGICFKSYFFNESNALRMTKQINVPLHVVDICDEHFNMVKNPKHGYGKNVNPCIDCHAMMLNYTGKLLEELEADFIITGEVLNQRPMSQNKSSLDIVKKESGFSDKILRPLCAKNLVPTEMELQGLVDREKLLDIKGRSRKIQMQLAKDWGIKDYPSPAGGCKLTEPNYSIRLKDLLKFCEDIKERDLELLRYGRHFRVSKKARIISTRTLDESQEMRKFLRKDDLVFFAEDFNGSMIVIVGEPSEDDIVFAAKITGRYSKGKDEKLIKIKYGNFLSELSNHIAIKPALEDEINNHII